MQRIFIFVLVIGVILVGCSNDVIENDNLPQNSPNDSSNDEESPKFAPNLHIVYQGNSVMGVRDKWCFEEPDKTCDITPSPPNEILEDKSPITVSKGNTLNFLWAESRENTLFNPDVIELIKFKSDNEETVEVSNDQITLPLEKGKHYYSLTIKWTEDIKGEANYAFSVMVK